MSTSGILGNCVDQASGRLTLESGVPISTGDQVDAGTLYYTLYKGDRIALYDGSEWIFHQFTELSLDISGYTASRVYDIWMYDNAGTPTLEGLIWTDGTTRATALTTQNGVYVKTGATTRRYLGSICMSSVLGDCDDSEAFRGVWNYNNRVRRHMLIGDSTGHAYNTDTWRSWNNDATIRLQVVVGVQEEVIIINHNGEERGASSASPFVAVGYDSTSSYYGGDGTRRRQSNAASVQFGTTNAHLTGVGYHYYQAVQSNIGGAGTATFNKVYLDGMFKC